MEVRFLPPELPSAILGRMPRRAISILVPSLLVSVILPTPWAEAASPARELKAAQGRLNDITETIRVGTAVWLVLVRDVRTLQGEVRRGASEASRADLELANILPGWLALKASLHRAYREVKAVLEVTETLRSPDWPDGGGLGHCAFRPTGPSAPARFRVRIRWPTPSAPRGPVEGSTKGTTSSRRPELRSSPSRTGLPPGNRTSWEEERWSFERGTATSTTPTCPPTV